MLFKIKVVGKEGLELDVYYVEAEDIHEASKKAQKEAEEEYEFEKPVTVTSIEVISYGPVVR